MAANLLLLHGAFVQLQICDCPPVVMSSNFISLVSPSLSELSIVKKIVKVIVCWGLPSKTTLNYLLFTLWYKSIFYVEHIPSMLPTLSFLDLDPFCTVHLVLLVISFACSFMSCMHVHVCVCLGVYTCYHFLDLYKI